MTMNVHISWKRPLVFRRHLIMIYIIGLYVVHPQGTTDLEFTQTYGVVDVKAILRCSYNPPVFGHISTVIWRRAERFDRIFEYVNSNGQKYSKPVHAFKGRNVIGTLHTDPGYFDLIIYEPRKSDQVDFICEIFGNNSAYGRAEGRLKLTALPTRVERAAEVVDKNGKVIASATLNTTDTLNIINETALVNITESQTKLTCRAYKSKPIANITWDTTRVLEQKSQLIFNNDTEAVENTIEIKFNATSACAICTVKFPSHEPDKFVYTRMNVTIRNLNVQSLSPGRPVSIMSVLIISVVATLGGFLMVVPI